MKFDPCIPEFMTDPRYEKFRKLCRELSLEAKTINARKDIQFCGVAWDFEGLLASKIGRLIRNI